MRTNRRTSHRAPHARPGGTSADSRHLTENWHEACLPAQLRGIARACQRVGETTLRRHRRRRRRDRITTVALVISDAEIGVVEARVGAHFEVIAAALYAGVQ